MTDIILLRIIEAAMVSGRPGSAHGAPSPLRASWIDPSKLNATRADKALRKMSWFERNTMHQGEVEGTREKPDAWRPDPQALARSEEVFCEWIPQALSHMPDEATCLWAYAFSRCGGQSFRRFCERNGISRALALRMKDDALQQLTEHLGTHYVAISQAEPSLADQITTETHTSDIGSPLYVRSGDRLLTPMSPQDIARIEASITAHNERVRKAKARRQRRKRKG